MRDRIDFATENGYDVDLIFVDTPTDICLYRNRLRGFDLTQEQIQRQLRRNARGPPPENDGYGAEEEAFDEGHFVPEDILLDKAGVIQTSFNDLVSRVRKAVRVEPEQTPELKSELERAQLDLYFYPAPRDQSVPPTDPLYGVAPDGAAIPASSGRRTLRMAHWKRDPRVAHKKKGAIGMDGRRTTE